MASFAALYQECKDLKQRIINEQQYIEKLQAFIKHHMPQTTEYAPNGMSPSLHQRAQEAQRVLAERQQVLANLRTPFAIEMTKFINALTLGRDQLYGRQNQLFSGQLEEFKICQMRAQVGAPFPNKEEQIGNLQQEFEVVAEENIKLRQCAVWMINLLEPPSDAQEQDYIAYLSQIHQSLEQMFDELIPRSVLVTEQPEAVLKTGHKIGTELRLLVAEKLGIQPQLDLARITVKIISEETAQQLLAGTVSIAQVKEVGKISIPVETMDQIKRIVTFKNSKLSSIDKRNQPTKTTTKIAAEAGEEKLAAARKYVLLFQFSPLDIGTRLGKIDLWTLTNPLMVTVHTSQVCLAHAAISWHHGFSPMVQFMTLLKIEERNLNSELLASRYSDRNDIKNWSSANVEAMAVSCQQMKEMLYYKFSHFTGATRALSDSDLNYLLQKLQGQLRLDEPITYRQFAEQSLMDGNFSFWSWFFAVMELIKDKLMDYWNEGYLVGFISKADTSEKIMTYGSATPTFILRFSDSILGSLSIGFWGQGEPLHLQPFTRKDLDDCPLLQRIMTCPQLANISHIYPNKDKEQMRQYIERKQPPAKPKAAKGAQDNLKRYYVKHHLAMVVVSSKTSHQQGTSALGAEVQQSPAGANLESPSFSVGSFTNSVSPSSQDSAETWVTADGNDIDIDLFEEDVDLGAFDLLPNMELMGPMGLEDLEDVLEVLAKDV